MKIIVTTSDNYHHLLPVFFYLYKKYWDEPFVLLGHAKPECELPDNCTWVSMGPQTGVNDWSTGILDYLLSIEDKYFVWIMEDTFIKEPVDITRAIELTGIGNVGRVNLTSDVSKREHTKADGGVLYASPTSRYRLSTQPTIWNKDFLFQYMKTGVNPWDFETQDPKNDGWNILALDPPPMVHNEGVTKRDIYKLNLDGMCQEDIDYIKTITDKWDYL